MSKTKNLLMQVAACMYPTVNEDEQILSYLFSKQTEDYSQ
jgi:hypothetical protein